MMRFDADPDRRRGGIREAADLAALVRESVAANAVRDVLHFRLSTLSPSLRRPHHQRLLRDALDPIRAAARTRVFDLPNGDIVAVSTPPGLALESVRQALIDTLDASAEPLVVVMRLPDGAAHVLSVASESLGFGHDAALSNSVGATEGALAPLTCFDVAMAESAIAQADLEAMTLAQDVCRLDPSGDPAEPLWEDRRIAWNSLADAILPGVDIAASSALQRRLARLAETRMLAELGRPAAQQGWSRVGLPLAPATLLSPAFQRFDAALPAGRRQDIILGIRPGDLLADPSGFASARDFAQRRGYRLALDDASAALLAVLPPARLGLDFIRIQWSPELAAQVPDALAALLAQPDRLVLVGVNRPAAIAWGWEVGIRAFQGSLVERRRAHG